MNAARVLAATCLLLIAAGNAISQTSVRRLTTVAALREYPGYFHLQNVLLHGEFVESGGEIVLRGGDRDIQILLNGGTSTTGLVEIRGQCLSTRGVVRRIDQ